jgi:hypothetical protein
MSNFRITPLLIVAALVLMLFSVTACDSYKQAIPPTELTGVWVGLGQNKLGNEFLNQREIPVMLDISDKGVVNGFIGDADFPRTNLTSPAWWLKIFGKKGYRLDLTLTGNIVNRESFRRDGGILTLGRVKDGELLCHFTSTGSQVSSKNLILEIKEIKLHHPL